jgi:predicted histone-like DNA-binding protein
MAINYKIVKTPQAGVKGGGSIKYLAVATGRKVVDTDELSKMLEKRCTVTRADVAAVLTGLADLMPELFQEGCSVQLAKIGIFSPTIICKPLDTPSEVNHSSISGLRIRFLADQEMKKLMKDCDFKKVNG